MMRKNTLCYAKTPFTDPINKMRVADASGLGMMHYTKFISVATNCKKNCVAWVRTKVETELLEFILSEHAQLFGSSE